MTANGSRRAFLLEFKYTESYRLGASKGIGDEGNERRRRYLTRYTSPRSCFSGAAPLDEVLYEPFYQIARLGMLGDAMCADQDLDLVDARLIVVCPRANVAYRDRITSPELATRFPNARTVEDVARSLWKDPAGFAMIDPAELVAPARVAGGPLLEPWSSYLGQRYGW